MSKNLLMNTAIKSAHHNRERNVDHINNVWKTISNSDIQAQELVQGKICIINESLHLCPHAPTSHQRECELIHMEMKLWVANKGMGSSIYK